VTVATLVVVAWIAADVGFLLGVLWHAWTVAKREQTDACRRVWIFIAASLRSGGNVRRTEPVELLRQEDLQYERRN